MIGLILNYVDQTERVAKAAERAVNRSLSQASYAISQDAKSTIQRATKEQAAPRGNGPQKARKRWKHSRPGEVPLTRGKPGKNLKGAIRYKVDKAAGEAVIGPDASIIGDVGLELEFGKKRPGADEDYVMEARPFMGPALDRNDEMFGGSFQGSIGE